MSWIWLLLLGLNINAQALSVREAQGLERAQSAKDLEKMISERNSEQETLEACRWEIQLFLPPVNCYRATSGPNREYFLNELKSLHLSDWLDLCLRSYEFFKGTASNINWEALPHSSCRAKFESKSQRNKYQEEDFDI